MRRIEEEKKDEPPGFLNFWELNLTNEEEKESERCVFDQFEKERIINVMLEFIEKKRD